MLHTRCLVHWAHAALMGMFFSGATKMIHAEALLDAYIWQIE